MFFFLDFNFLQFIRVEWKYMYHYNLMRMEWEWNVISRTLLFWWEHIYFCEHKGSVRNLVWVRRRCMHYRSYHSALIRQINDPITRSIWREYSHRTDCPQSLWVLHKLSLWTTPLWPPADKLQLKSFCYQKFCKYSVFYLLHPIKT